MRSRYLLVLLPVLLLLAGCAGIKPAVQPPPPNILKKVDGDASKAQPATEATEATEASESEAATPADPGTTGAEKTYPEPTPNDELELPSNAMPSSGGAFEATEVTPAADAEPPELVDGWKVQVLSLTDRKAVNSAYTDLKLRLKGFPMHLRYADDRYVLLAGGYPDRAPADSLRDLLHAQGYPDAFVVEAPVVADSLDATAETEPATEAEAADPTEKPAMATSDGWRIQIMSLGSRTGAEQEAKKAEVRIGQPVYIAEVDGMYKLRVGDFTDEPSARLEQQRIGTLGFEGSFLVTDTVNVSGEGASKE